MNLDYGMTWYEQQEEVEAMIGQFPPVTKEDVLAISNFLGDNMSCEQAEQLMDLARQLSITDREWLMNRTVGALYTELSMNAGEMGGY